MMWARSSSSDGGVLGEGDVHGGLDRGGSGERLAQRGDVGQGTAGGELAGAFSCCPEAGGCGGGVAVGQHAGGDAELGLDVDAHPGRGAGDVLVEVREALADGADVGHQRPRLVAAGT